MPFQQQCSSLGNWVDLVHGQTQTGKGENDLSSATMQTTTTQSSDFHLPCYPGCSGPDFPRASDFDWFPGTLGIYVLHRQEFQDELQQARPPLPDRKLVCPEI